MTLLDRDRAHLAVIGPFPSVDAADAWRPTADRWPSADRLLLPVHTPTAWD